MRKHVLWEDVWVPRTPFIYKKRWLEDEHFLSGYHQLLSHYVSFREGI